MRENLRQKWQWLKPKLRKSAGFASAGIGSFLIFRFGGIPYDSITMGFLYIIILITVEYIHNNPIKYGHIGGLFFWVFYLFVFNAPGSRSEIASRFFLSTIFGVIAALMPLAMAVIIRHRKSKSKN